jgi:cephalosporin hydroxylase
MNKIHQIFKESKYSTIKYKNYFSIYSKLFEKYVNKKITFVEIGILNGGSLFVWKKYFGKNAKIIGIDLNPDAKKFEKYGFKIFIGDQADPKFWKNFFKKENSIDIVLDDGGHTNKQQIITTNSCIPNINDGGMLVIEDTHTSYQKEFNNPSKYSFINYSKKIIDDINYRFPKLGSFKNSLNNKIYSVEFFESIVCFHVNKNLCKTNILVDNKKKSLNHRDFRYFKKEIKIFDKLFFLKRYFKKNKLVKYFN